MSYILVEVAYKIEDAKIALESNLIAISEEKAKNANLNKQRRERLLNKFPLSSASVIEYLTHNMSGAGIDDLIFCTNAKTAERSLDYAKLMIDKKMSKNAENVLKVINALALLTKNDHLQAESAQGATWESVWKESTIGADMMFKSLLRVAMQHGLVQRLDNAGFNATLKASDRVKLI